MNGVVKTGPTKQQWDEIEERLDRQFSPVYLRCDGFLVHASLERVDKNRLAIVIGVNGWAAKGKWFPINGREMSEEARRFWRPVKRAKTSRKVLGLYEKLYGKKECRARGYYESFVWPNPLWMRPRPFIAHMKKHNTDIEVIDYETYAREVEALHAQDEGPAL